MIETLNIKITNSTPLLVGWYRPEIADYIGIRPTEIKGIWRWWARAFMGGVLYDMGYLRGGSSEGVLRKPTPREIKVISRLVGVSLGLGLVGEHASMASRFKITVLASGVNKASLRSLGAWSSSQRASLLTLKDRGVEAIEHGHTFTLTIEVESRTEYVDTALKILLASIQLSGVGKGSRRGLGSLDIKSIEGDLSVTDKLRKYTRGPDGLRSLLSDIYKECEEIIHSEIHKMETGVSRTLGYNVRETLPPIPVVSRETVLGEPVTKINVYRDVNRNMFIKVHNFFVRTERCKVIYGSAICRDRLRTNLNAWFIGLPRVQKGTGYFTKDVVRRASPIHLALHTDANILGGGAFVTVLLSGDWPRTIKWRGSGGEIDIQVTDQRIIDAYHDFEQEFRRYMERINAGRGITIWP